MAILDGIATILWATAWANHVEECGCQSLSGCDITDVMPEIPQEACTLAVVLQAHIVEKTGKSLDELYADAIAMGDHGSADRFGECLAFEAMGDGVSWTDEPGNDWELPSYVHIDTSDLTQFAEEQCGCMDRNVCVRSSEEWIDEDGQAHSEPGKGRTNTVYLDVHCENYRAAKTWADKHQSADGSYWECARDLGGLVYNIVYDRPSLIDDLKAEGYKLDLSEYSPDDA